MKSANAINESIITAHKQNDRHNLARLYENLGMFELKRNNIDAGCFFLTNAYTYALEEDLNSAKKIHKILKLLGREE